VLWTLAIAGCLAAGATIALAYGNDQLAEPGLRAGLVVWVVVPYIAAGLIAWWRRPESRFGPLMVAAGFGFFVSTLQWSTWAVPYTIGMAFDLLVAVMFLHVFLAFPSGRLEGRPEQILVAAGYFAGVGLQLVKMLLSGFIPDNLLGVVDEFAAANTLEDIQLVALSAILLAGIPVLIARQLRSGRPLRRWTELLVDSFAVALVAVALLLLAGAFEWPSFETIRRVTFAIIGVSPIAFLIGLLSARLARSTVADLLVQLHADPAPADLPQLFARALRDPELTLAYWLPQYETWADLDGQPVTLEADRATTVIERDGVRLAALVHNPSLKDEPELLEAVSAAAGIALENGRLQAELRANLEELRGSRERVVQASQEERQRLERNLHDGAQQRLIALSLDLSMLESKLGDDSEARAQIDQARQEIAHSLEELRAVAHGLHPAVVSGHGLAVALESLEVAAYYVVSESLANIGKHAQASSATIAVTRDNGQLVVEVVDDGIGGADSEAGSGLRGLADRVEALDGRLRVWTPQGGGTRVRAEMPCG
jgi:signal transduction histidine kinase